MCGDIHCGSCGPMFGHGVCEECGWCDCSEADHVTETKCIEESIKHYAELEEEYKREEELAEEDRKYRKPMETGEHLYYNEEQQPTHQQYEGAWDEWYNKQTDWDKAQIDLYRNEKYGFCTLEELVEEYKRHREELPQYLKDKINRKEQIVYEN